MKLKILVLIIVALVMTGCLAKEDDSTSASFLVINSLTGKDLEGTDGSTIVFSDVVTSSGSIVNDNGVASITTLTYNPLEDSAGNDITFYMNVIVDQIDVEFMRTDGRNVEGVDVPYSFTQPMNMIVPVDEVVDIPFVLIRHVAKLEPPLFALSQVPNQGKVLQLVAKVTVHGKDLGGHRVAPVSGYVSVWCANFADSAPEEDTGN